MYQRNDAPIISNPVKDIFVKEGNKKVINFNKVFSDPDDDLLTLSAKLLMGKDLPSWLKFDALTNELTINPSRSEYPGETLELKAVDGDGQVALETFSIKHTYEYPKLET